MPDYGLVPESINRLADRFRGLSQDKMAHSQRMQEFGLTNARLGLEGQTLAGERAIKMAQIKRDAYLDEPVTFGVAIQTSKMPDKNKAILLKSIPDDILNVPTTRRKAFDAYMQIRKQIAARQEAEKTRTFEAEQRRLDREASAKEGRLGRASREKIAGMRQATEKDTRSTMQKEVEFIQGTLGITKQQALEKYQKDKSLPERIRLYNNELDRLAGDFDFQDLNEEQKADKVSELRKSYEIPVAKKEERPKELTRELAIEYMRKAKGDKAKAIKMAQDDGYPIYEDVTAK